jgi:hypothetical protein
MVMYNANASGAYWEEQREIAEAIEGNAIEGATYNAVMESVLRLGRDHEATMTRKAVELRLAEEDAPRVAEVRRVIAVRKARAQHLTTINPCRSLEDVDEMLAGESRFSHAKTPLLCTHVCGAQTPGRAAGR